jgi:hypothetical protein
MIFVRIGVLLFVTATLGGCAVVDWYVAQLNQAAKIGLYMLGTLAVLGLIAGFSAATTLGTRMALYGIGFLIVYSLIGSDYPGTANLLLVIGFGLGFFLFARDSGLLGTAQAKMEAKKEERQHRQEELVRLKAEQERQATQRLALAEHTRLQSDAAKEHKRKLAAKHLNQLALYAEDLDGSEEDRAFLDQMMRESVAFVEDESLAEAVRYDEVLQRELAMLLASLETKGQAERAIFARLSNLKR